MFIQKKYAIIVIVLFVFAVLVVSFVIVKVSEKNIKSIDDYEKKTLSIYSSNEVLDNSDERNLYLDQIEQYLIDNKKKLLIKKIDRLEDSITVEFIFGNKYMVYPNVKNMK